MIEMTMQQLKAYAEASGLKIVKSVLGIDLVDVLGNKIRCQSIEGAAREIQQRTGREA